MQKKIGRNDYCPCGSGMKYKKCCQKKEEDLASRRRAESSAISNAVYWLTQHYPQQISDAIEHDFFATIEKTERDRFNMVSTGLQGRIQFNFHDWLINDACFDVGGEKKAVHELLLGADREQLTPADRECLKTLGENPLSLYEVQKVKPGEGVELADLLNSSAGPVWIIEKIASRLLTPLDIFGTRLLSRDNAFVMSGAVYPFNREEALACRDDILRENEGAQRDSTTAREVVCRQIIKHWLAGLVSKYNLLTLDETTKKE